MSFEDWLLAGMAWFAVIVLVVQVLGFTAKRRDEGDRLAERQQMREGRRG